MIKFLVQILVPNIEQESEPESEPSIAYLIALSKVIFCN